MLALHDTHNSHRDDTRDTSQVTTKAKNLQNIDFITGSKDLPAYEHYPMYFEIRANARSKVDKLHPEKRQ